MLKGFRRAGSTRIGLHSRQDAWSLCDLPFICVAIDCECPKWRPTAGGSTGHLRAKAPRGLQSNLISDGKRVMRATVSLSGEEAYWK
jgi:hypothetical protein